MDSRLVVLLNQIILPLDLIFNPRLMNIRIVGSTGEEVGISSIKAGDGVTATTILLYNNHGGKWS